MRDHKIELSFLRKNIRGTGISATGNSEVMKIKTDTDLHWKYEGNQVQFNSNADIANAIKQDLWAIEYNEMDYIKIFTKTLDKLKKQIDWNCRYF